LCRAKGKEEVSYGLVFEARSIARQWLCHSVARQRCMSILTILFIYERGWWMAMSLVRVQTGAHSGVRDTLSRAVSDFRGGAIFIWRFAFDSRIG
jgi:hypothetical protein